MEVIPVRLRRIFREAKPGDSCVARSLVFAFHVAEEAPGFVDWFNGLVTNGISQQLFLAVNAWAFAITALLAALFRHGREFRDSTGDSRVAELPHVRQRDLPRDGDRGSRRLLTGSGHRRYPVRPLLYVVSPTRYEELPGEVAHVIVTIALSSLPMSVHGYLIVFEGDRLFGGTCFLGLLCGAPFSVTGYEPDTKTDGSSRVDNRDRRGSALARVPVTSRLGSRIGPARRACRGRCRVDS